MALVEGGKRGFSVLALILGVCSTGPSWAEDWRTLRPIDLPAELFRATWSDGTYLSEGHPITFGRTAVMMQPSDVARTINVKASSNGVDGLFIDNLTCYNSLGGERIGSIFWRGTYVFAGNPSTETLLAGLRQVRPTGLISIPLRWTQIRDRTIEAMADAGSSASRAAAFRSVVGDRLRWGLSAAGYLEPKVFQHFNHFGVGLCSGFGMTEATGGITMSPPGDYLPDSVGVPLPGIRVRLTEAGEMRIAGPYVARHLADEGEELELEPAVVEDGEEWLATGDLFRTLARGHLTIVDRIKDIYKNDRGQTIAPQRVERKFHGVPGIRRAFLVGDHRSYNVLLIVPDPGDPVLRDAPDEASRQEYFHRIVAAANENLAPYERVVNFALLERDLDLERGELTAKGTYRRKVVERSFAAVVDGLYQSPWVEIPLDGLRLRIPRWFFRDLGILEHDLRAEGDGLFDRRRGIALPLHREPGEPLVRVGDLDYRVEGDAIDLGVFARQPRLWMGNPAFIRFAPCKEGWDVAMAGISSGVLLPRAAGQAPDRTVRPQGIGSSRLLEVNDLLHAALFGPAEEALAALESLSQELTQSDDRVPAVIRSRIAALARHGDQRLRCLAYRILLLDEPLPGYEVAFPSFIESGLPFLDEDAIAAIALARFEQRRLQLLRQRLLGYRAQLAWPAAEHTREQFRGILSLLASFARRHPDYYKPVRAELTCWVLHREDPPLAAFAQEVLDELSAWFESQLEREAPPGERDRLRAAIQFDEEIVATDRERIRHLFFETGFLRESVILTFDEQDFDLEQIGDGGLWVSPMPSRGAYQLYRLSVNTRRHRHFDLLVILRSDMDAAAVRLTNYWMVAIGEHPLGDRTLPRFGCVRPDLAAMSLEFVREPSVAERIRVLAGAEDPRGWRTLYVRGLAAFFRAWHDSARRIVPGAIDPSNVAVPDPDYHEGTLILSLAGWEPYEDTLSLFRPMCRTFYTEAAEAPPGRHADAPVRVDLRGVRGSARRARGVRAAHPFRPRGPHGGGADGPGPPRLPGRVPGPLPGALLRAAGAVERHRPLRGVEPRQRRGHRRGPRPAAGPAHRPLPPRSGSARSRAITCTVTPVSRRPPARWGRPSTGCSRPCGRSRRAPPPNASNSRTCRRRWWSRETGTSSAVSSSRGRAARSASRS